MVNIPLNAIEGKSKSLIFLMIKHVLGRYDGYFHLQSHNPQFHILKYPDCVNLIRSRFHYNLTAGNTSSFAR